MNASMYRKGLFDGALSWLEDEVISVCVFVCVLCVEFTVAARLACLVDAFVSCTFCLAMVSEMGP